MVFFNKKLGRGAIILSAVFFLLLSGAGISDAAQPPDHQTVNAGIFYFDGYHMKDEEGNLSGYGIEFLNLASEYSHLNFNYKGYDKTWNEMLAMLEAGEIDVVTSARMLPSREEKFAFSLPIGRSDTVLSVQAEDTRFRTGDYRSYDGIVVGELKESNLKQSLSTFAEEKGFSFQLREYVSSDELAEALQSGSIDAILSSNLRKTENEKELDTIVSDNFYAIVRKEDVRLLDEINYAIEQMERNEGDWSNVLFYKYYGPVYSSALSFTERERAYIQDVISGRKTITATAMGNRKPYSYVEDGEMKGILPDYFDRVMALAGLPYEIVQPQDGMDYDMLAGTNQVDVVIDRRESDMTTEEDLYRGFTTDTYMATGIAKVTRKDFSGEISTVAVADVQGNVLTEQGLLEDADILRFATREEVLQAVLDRKADAAYVYTYAAQLFVNNDPTDSLHYSVVSDIDFEFRMYVRDSCDHELVTILNKCIHQMPEDTINRLITQYTSYTPENMSFLWYVRVHPEVMLAIVLVLALGSGTILALYLWSRWNKKTLAASERMNRNLEAQLAVVDALSRDYINVFAIDKESKTSRSIKTKGEETARFLRDLQEEIPYGEMVAKYVGEHVYAEDEQYLAEALSLPVIEEKLQKYPEYTGSYRALVDGEMHNFQFTFVEMKRRGTMGGFILAGFRNIDEMVRKEREQKDILALALAEAQHANNAKTTFLNNMSHDIRTPMNAIIGFTTLANTHIDNRDLVQNYLGKIMTSSNHLLSLINDVLDMSRIESGKVKIEEREACLPEILHDLRTIVQSDVKAKQLDFSIDTLDVTNERIICDKLRLNQVLLNILSNAMKYTRPGGAISVRIIQSGDAQDGYVSYKFQIRDTGIGMSKTFLKHIFEPFEREQTATVSGIQGTGLGLAITKNIVDMMRGTITVDSEEGKGSEFTVSFRFRVAGEPVRTDTLKELKDLHALIVDDDINICMSISKMASSIGMRTDWTTSGKEAVYRTEFALEQKDPFQIYILDWMMPDMNGIETARRIRKVAGDKGQILMTSAYDWADIEEEAREAGVTSFCSKPVFLSELCKALGEPYKKQEEERKLSEQQLAGRKLLLVEDNELNQEIAKTILEEEGFVVDTADDGTIAVEKMKEMPADAYDLILMDIQMPMMDGYEATRIIRAMEDPVKCSIPIVAMTANAFEEDRQKAMDAGMSGHLAKPIDIDRLFETLREILQG